MWIVVAANEPFGLVQSEYNLTLLAMPNSLPFVNDFVDTWFNFIANLGDLAIYND